ncbi:alpha-E domain-containing protein [Brachybacterium muris]|uniref:alpha-E domain-containing protein n=1 Tax=Brachybacterium muris TaxID=219301 RepID=UPI00223BB14A|nr:alpha-E domain-containing protein [Brachybacterium muris]MCT1429314.1 alpha-E domain-containing protein [Brachybacterium muris]MCT1653961.1 alpha-E domain-containing protein [Brachybacterium muris]MCT2177386.1 alpha-E domain-containing protein [Brachybacterium muris]MCT2295566.1 alpha-E domain-containing protein [Brachybacterium muris]
MLSRIAEAVFWIGRYVERADQTARILDVSLQSITEDATHDVGTACKDVYSIFGASVEDTSDLTVQRILDRLVTDRQNPSSIAGALQTARENARGAREVLSTEVWESLNTTTLGMPRGVRPSRMHGAFQYAKDRCAVVNGLIDASMTRDEAWLFLRIGQLLERVDMVARILQAHDLEDASDGTVVMLLRSCSAHEAYIRSYRGRVRAARAIEFLLLDSIFPRSAAHCLIELDEALETLAKLHGSSFDRMGTEDPARRIVGRAAASLRYRSLDDIVADFETEMEQLQRVTVAVSRALKSTYFEPST